MRVFRQLIQIRRMSQVSDKIIQCILKHAEKASAQYKQLAHELESSPPVESQIKLSKSLHERKPYHTFWEKYMEANQRIKEAEALLLDTEMKELAEEEITIAQQEQSELLSELRALIMEQHESEFGNCILEIRAGVGGQESALFASELLQAYQKYASSCNLTTSVVSSNVDESGGTREAIISIKGNAYRKFKYESGVHRVQRIPQTESQGRVHTTTVTVAVLPEPTEAKLELLSSDLKIETMRSSGPGGQNVNKVESAVRVTHIPTNMSVFCQQARSQHINRQTALEVLKSRLLQQQQNEIAKERGNRRSTLVGSADRSEKIRTFNFPQSRITDHRIGFTFHDLQGFMNGTSICKVVDELKVHEEIEILENEIEAE